MLKVAKPQNHHRSLYTFEEDTKIVKYIIAKKMYYDLRGNLSWKNMETDGVCPGRSWQSLKERFRKCIIYNLFKLKISDEEKNKVYNCYHNCYASDDMDVTVVTTQIKRNNTNDKDANEDHDINKESENGQINTKRKRITNKLEDCDVNSSSIKFIKTLKSTKTKTVTENNSGENSSDMRKTNLTEDDETVEKSKKFDTALDKNCIQNGAGNIISKDMKDNEDPRIRNTLIKKISYKWGEQYSAEEDKQIVLFFKRNIGTLRSESVYETVQQDCGLRRTTSSLRRRFIDVILPKLYTYKELSYLDMISIYDSMGHEVPIQAQELINKDIEAQSSQSTLDELEIIKKNNQDIPQIVKKVNVKQKHSPNLKTFEKRTGVVSTDDPNWRAKLESVLCDLFRLPESSVTDGKFESKLPVKNVDEVGNSKSSTVLEVESPAKEISVIDVNDYNTSTLSLSNAEISPVISCMDNNMLSIVMKHFENVQHAFILNRNCDFTFLHTHLTDKHGILPENIHIVDQEFFETFVMCAQAKIDFKKEIAKICKIMCAKDVLINNSKLVIKENIALCYPKKRLCKKHSRNCLRSHKIPSTTNPEARVTLDDIVLEISRSETEFDNAGVHKNDFKNSQNPRVNSSESGCSTITQVDLYDEETDVLDTDSSNDCRSLSNMSLTKSCTQNKFTSEGGLNNLTSLATSEIIEPCNQDTSNDWERVSTQINEWLVASTQIHELNIGSTQSNKLDSELTQINELDLEITQINDWDPSSGQINEFNSGLTQNYLNNKTSSIAIHLESVKEKKIQNITETDANNHILLLPCNRNIVKDEMSLESIQEDIINKISTKMNQDNPQNLSDNEMDLGSTQDNTQTSFLTCNQNISNEMDLGSTQEDSTNNSSTKLNQDRMQNFSVNEMDLGSTQDTSNTQTTFLTCNENISNEMDLELTQENTNNHASLKTSQMDLGPTQDSTNKTSSNINQMDEDIIIKLEKDEMDFEFSEDGPKSSIPKIRTQENYQNEIYDPCQNVVAEEIVKSEYFFKEDSHIC